MSSAWKHGPFLPFLPIASGSAPMSSPPESPSRPFSLVPQQTWAHAPPVFPAMLQPALLEGQSQYSSSGFVSVLHCLHAKSLQLYPTLCDPMDCSPPGFSVPGILVERILEWVPFPSPRDLPDPRDQTFLSYVSCIGRLALYHCATWEALCLLVQSINPLEGFYKKQFIFIYLYPLHITQCLMQRRAIIKLFLFFINKMRPAGTSFLHENNCSSRVLLWTSLVVQYVRIRLPVTGTQVRSLVWEDSTCHGAAKARGPQLLSLCSGACAVQQEEPRR